MQPTATLSPTPDTATADGLGPDEASSGTDIGQRIAAAVARLPGEQREVFLMRTEADLSFKEKKMLLQ